MGKKLQGGDILPQIELQLAGGDHVSLPSGIETPFATILFYRGHW